MASSPTSTRPRSGTAGSIASAARTVKNAGSRVLDTDMPLGFLAASANATAMAPSLIDIRRGSFGSQGWSPEAQMSQQETQMQAGSPTSNRQRASTARSGYKPSAETLQESTSDREDAGQLPAASLGTSESQYDAKRPEVVLETGAQPKPLSRKASTFPNGYIEPPKIPWTKSTMIGFIAFMKWFFTPFGFLVTIYGLNIVAWGGMLFLLLCGAAPAMCSPNTPANGFDGCNDINSPRRIWIEIDSQILNALFCVTGFGLVPWRARDLYWLLKWRFASERRQGRAAKLRGLRMLAGIHNGWFRLPGSDSLDSLGAETGHVLEEADERLPLPLSKAPSVPLTGVRAQPTRLWLLDFVIWCNVWNTIFQACLCGFMWGMNRYDRPSWSTGLFVALACGVAGVGGVTMFVQGKRVKKVEGVAPDGGNGGDQAIGVKGEP